MNSLSQPWTPGPDNKPVYEFLPGDIPPDSRSSRGATRNGSYSEWKNCHFGSGSGCGNGTSYAAFSERSKAVRCVGLDIVDSPEVALRPRKALPFCTYDGIRVPLADDSFDMVYSRQVFEHVRYPENVIAEAYRVLKPGGYPVDLHHNSNLFTLEVCGTTHRTAFACFSEMQGSKRSKFGQASMA